MFFVAWFWAYFDASLFPSLAIGGTWPPKDIVTFDPWDIPLINTLILLLSGTTVTWSHHALLEGDRKSFIQGLVLTVILGFSFSLLQVYEYQHATFDFAGNIYGSVFYMATATLLFLYIIFFIKYIFFCFLLLISREKIFYQLSHNTMLIRT
jgi:cytochrome c oxidase subunit 3